MRRVQGVGGVCTLGELFRELPEEYGGPYAFSEPETQAVKCLVERHSSARLKGGGDYLRRQVEALREVRGRLREEARDAAFDSTKQCPFPYDAPRFFAALNFHTFGEFWTRPFNCCRGMALPNWASKAFDELQR